MGSISLFFETKQGKYIKNMIIGVGAGVVLLGALFKINHWEGATMMLTIGMVTEAFIFCLLGILPPHKDYYWERYYPNLDENPHVEAYKTGIKFKPPTTSIGGASNTSATLSLDKMMEEANINTPNLKRLNENFQRFGQTVEQMKDITDVTAATGSYSQSARDAATALGQMKDTFLGAANNHLKAMNKFYGNLVNASDAMASSANDAVAAKEQIAILSKNLASLNNIYGNMLSAMQGR